MIETNNPTSAGTLVHGAVNHNGYFKHLPVAITHLQVSAEGTIKFCNDEFLKQLGYEFLELQAKEIETYIHKSSHIYFEQAICEITTKAKKHVTLNLAFNHKTEGICWMLTSFETSDELSNELVINLYGQNSTHLVDLNQDFIRFRQIIRTSQDSVYLMDTEYRFREVSDLYLEIQNKTRSEIIGLTMLEVSGEDYFFKAKKHIDDALLGEFADRTKWVEHKTKGKIFLDIKYQSVTDEQGGVIGVLGYGRDITNAKLLSNQLEHQAQFDELTKLYNRRKFDQELNHIFENKTSGNGASKVNALCYIDLDQFKIVNDTAGHAAGDQLLRQVANIIKTNLRSFDILARLGGDEFGIIFKNCPIEIASKAMERILVKLQDFSFYWEGQFFKIGASAGLVMIEPNDQTPQEVMSMADIACYSAKDDGRNRLVVYQEDGSTAKERHIELMQVNDVQLGMTENRFCLYYQTIRPVVQDGTGIPIYEALLRLTSPEGELISPGAFIPAAERFGLMAELDRWVIKTVITDYATIFQEIDIGIVSLNLSGVSLSDMKLLEYIKDLLEDSKVKPEQLCFEITETAVISHFEIAMKTITGLREMGCHLALDDFGSGLSSFSYLKSFPVDILKIDGSLVKDITTNESSRVIVSAINDIGHTMDILTVAEFVETQADIDLLSEIKLDYLQGYGIAKPRPMDDLLANIPND